MFGMFAEEQLNMNCNYFIRFLALCLTGFGMVKEALGECAFFGRGEPECIMTDNCEAERKALATMWPDSKLFLCVFTFYSKFGVGF